MNKKIVLGAFFAVAVTSANAQIASWNFETTTVSSTPGTNLASISADLGAGSFTGFHANAATVFSTPAGNGSTKAVSATAWGQGDYWQWQVSTTGFSNIVVSYDQTGSNTGPKDFVFQYSTDGVNFTNFGAAYTLTNDAWSPTAAQNPASFHSFDLSSVASVNNASSIWFRATVNSTTSINNGTIAAGGTSRIDNINVVGQPVPEPASMAALGLGALALIRRRRASK